MLRLPRVKPTPEPPLRKMTLVEYAHFSERCLRDNPAMTPENCLTRYARERDIRTPFRLR